MFTSTHNGTTTTAFPPTHVHLADKYASMYTPVENGFLSFTLIVILLVSLCGNVLMLVILSKNDKMWTSTNMLLGNLSATGVLITCLCMPFNVISITRGRWLFGEGDVCKFQSICVSMFLFTSIFTHVLISIDKYYAIVTPFKRTMTATRTVYLIGIVWGLSVCMTILPLLNIGGFAYNHTTSICGLGPPRDQKDTLYYFLLMMVGFVLPVIVMLFIYVKIFYSIRSHKKRLRRNTMTHKAASSQVFVLQRNLIHMVFYSFICFIVCWSVFFLFALLGSVYKDEAGEKMPRGLGVAAYCCAYANNALYPIIVCSKSSRFHDGMKTFYRGILAVLDACCTRNTKYKLGGEADAGKPNNNGVDNPRHELSSVNGASNGGGQKCAATGLDLGNNIELRQTSESDGAERNRSSGKRINFKEDVNHAVAASTIHDAAATSPGYGSTADRFNNGSIGEPSYQQLDRHRSESAESEESSGSAVFADHTSPLKRKSSKEDAFDSS